MQRLLCRPGSVNDIQKWGRLWIAEREYKKKDPGMSPSQYGGGYSRKKLWKSLNVLIQRH